MVLKEYTYIYFFLLLLLLLGNINFPRRREGGMLHILSMILASMYVFAQ